MNTTICGVGEVIKDAVGKDCRSFIVGIGGSLTVTKDTMVSGAQSMMSSVLRILASGILAGVLIRTGSAKKIAVVDSLPHGSFFHATGGAANMTIEERMKLIPFEARIGLTSTIVSVVMFML